MSEPTNVKGAKGASVEPIDGRRLRTERSREAIIDAALALMAEGNLIPTAQTLADRAGMKIRSFFRHFADMETLFAAVDEHSRDYYESLFLGGDREGSLEDRILHAVERRAEGYETQKNVILSTSALLWKSAVLKKNYARNQRGLRKDLDDWLPELKELPASKREAVDAIGSFEMWHRLRYHQGLSKRAAIELLAQMMGEQLGT
ncbi:MAG: TetR/AcrR family transcriptional regulator [Halioglobus sp.]